MIEISRTASLYDGPRAVGGTVHIARGRLTFGPHAFDRALAGRSFECPLESISAITLDRRRLWAPRRHVLIDTHDGSHARFLINRQRTFIQDVVAACRERGSSPKIVGL